ncbi:hypothetical protein [Hyalangium versicolor]|uniref:hypothetical protein n=1 Tax=Hyalangium versicolor TaxID=2861190 RepID=UPI001CCD7B95|nr:hypothetical protein [Hyalangium versicolor]
MFRKSRVLAACLASFVSTSAFAVELNYQWKKGDKHHFSYEDDTTFTMAMGGGMPGMPGMPGMGAMGAAGMQMKLQTTFTEKVLAVRKDGTADVELTVEKLDFFQGGNKVASISQIPPAARVVKAEVDRKGRAKFFQMVTVYQRDDQMFVGVHKTQVGPNGVSSSTTLGNQQVDLVASVDPKTGKVTASMKTTERPPALKKVTIKEEDPGVDVLPKQIFEMMVLPDGNMDPGKRVDVTMPMGTIHVELAALEGKVAKFRTWMDGSKVEASAPAEQTGAARKPGKKAAAAPSPSEDEALGGADVEGENPQMGGMNMGGMNMGGMNMGGMNMGSSSPTQDAMAAGDAPMGGVKTDLDVTAGFDVAAGKLLNLSGTLASEMAMGGMSGGAGGTKVNSRFTLKRIP